MFSISTIMSDFWEYRGNNSWNNKIHATDNGYSCPLIDTGGKTPWFTCYQRNRYIGPYGRSGKAIWGFLGHMTGARRQLPEIDIEIRYIMQVYAKVIAFGVIPRYIEQATQYYFSIGKWRKCGKSTKKKQLNIPLWNMKKLNWDFYFNTLNLNSLAFSLLHIHFYRILDTHYCLLKNSGHEKLLLQKINQ